MFNASVLCLLCVIQVARLGIFVTAQPTPTKPRSALRSTVRRHYGGQGTAPALPRRPQDSWGYPPDDSRVPTDWPQQQSQPQAEGPSASQADYADPSPRGAEESPTASFDPPSDSLALLEQAKADLMEVQRSLEGAVRRVPPISSSPAAPLPPPPETADSSTQSMQSADSAEAFEEENQEPLPPPPVNYPTARQYARPPSYGHPPPPTMNHRSPPYDWQNGYSHMPSRPMPGPPTARMHPVPSSFLRRSAPAPYPAAPLSRGPRSHPFPFSTGPGGMGRRYANWGYAREPPPPRRNFYGPPMPPSPPQGYAESGPPGAMGMGGYSMLQVGEEHVKTPVGVEQQKEKEVKGTKPDEEESVGAASFLQIGGGITTSPLEADSPYGSFSESSERESTFDRLFGEHKQDLDMTSFLSLLQKRNSGDSPPMMPPHTAEESPRSTLYNELENWFAKSSPGNSHYIPPEEFNDVSFRQSILQANQEGQGRSAVSRGPSPSSFSRWNDVAEGAGYAPSAMLQEGEGGANASPLDQGEEREGPAEAPVNEEGPGMSSPSAYSQSEGPGSSFVQGPAAGDSGEYADERASPPDNTQGPEEGEEDGQNTENYNQ